MAQITKSKMRALIRRIDAGETQDAVLRSEGISYGSWRKALDAADINWRPKRVYGIEVLRLVQRRARAGEFISDICTDLGLNYANLCRACRRAGIRILDQRSLRANVRRRNYSGPKREPGEPPKSMAIFEALDAGAGIEELVERFAISHSYAKLCRKQHREGGHLAKRRRHEERQQRTAEIRRLREQGLSMRELSARFGISYQRISQILAQER